MMKSCYARWILLGVALILGSLGAVLAAKVAAWMFWAGWVPALALVGVVICKVDGADTECGCCEKKETVSEPPTEG